MSSVFDKLCEEGLLNSSPKFLKNNVILETITGSFSYGCNLPGKSDFDIVGIGIPSKNILFPHLNGEIIGFGYQTKRFEQFQQHHIDYHGQKEYDISIYNIVKFFQLAMENNPNIIDVLYTDMDCITHINSIGQIIRENRKKFLHKGCYYKFLGYAYAQKSKMSSNKRTGKRKELYDKHFFDTKFASHLVRLSYECQMILEEGDLDLRRNSEHLKSIRRGDVTEQEINNWFSDKEKYLEKLYQESKLQNSPDEKVIKGLLLNCLEHHFGSLDKCIVNLDKYELAIEDIKKIIANL